MLGSSGLCARFKEESSCRGLAGHELCRSCVTCWEYKLRWVQSRLCYGSVLCSVFGGYRPVKSDDDGGFGSELALQT